MRSIKPGFPADALRFEAATCILLGLRLECPTLSSIRNSWAFFDVWRKYAVLHASSKQYITVCSSLPPPLFWKQYNLFFEAAFVEIFFFFFIKFILHSYPSVFIYTQDTVSRKTGHVANSEPSSVQKNQNKSQKQKCCVCQVQEVAAFGQKIVQHQSKNEVKML